MTAPYQPSQSRTQAEELVHTVTHGVGLLLSIVGATVLLGRVLSLGEAWRVIGCGVFAMALIAVYAASTLSHGITDPWRRVFRILDQGFIYLLIAGTYTPFALEYLRWGWWWLVLGLMWTIALCGLFSKIMFAHRIEAVSTWTYLALGWMPIAFAPAYVTLVPLGALWWVAVGGLCYTIGTVFLVIDYRRLHFHGIWHVCVMAGSGCHYCAVFLFVACAPLHAS
jgi:hemolysin III